MQKVLVFLILSILVVTGFAVGYESETGDAEDEESTLEDLVYDLQAGYVLENGDFSTSGPSNHFGSLANYTDTDGEILNTEQDLGAEGIENTLFNYYVEPEDGWGQGEIVSEEISANNLYVEEEDPRTGFSRQFYPPHPKFDSFDNRCGSLTEENYEIDCPADSGLPDQTTTNQQVDNTVTDNLGSYSVSANGNTYTDQVNYNMSLLVQEPYGSDDADITNRNSDGTYDYHVYDLDSNVEGVPDFYLNNDQQINAISYDTGVEHFGKYESIRTVTNTVVDEGSIDYYESDGSAYTDCDAGLFMSCDISDECLDPGGSQTVWNYITQQGSVDLSESTDTYQTEQASNGGYSVNTGSNQLDINVIRQELSSLSSSQSVDTSCTEETTYTGSCSGQGQCLAQSQNPDEECFCDPQSSETTYSKTGSTSDDSYDIYDIEFRYETAEIVDNEEVFNTDPGQNPNSNDVREALFEGADFGSSLVSDFSSIVAVSVGNQGYFSNINYGMPTNFASNHANAVSSFILGTEGGDFVSERDSFEAYKPDGQDNTRSGYIAVRHDTFIDNRLSSFEVLGSTEGLITGDDTTQLGDNDESITNNYQSLIQSQLESQDFECPEDSVYCIAAVGTYMEELGTTDENDLSSNWGGTVNPNQGIRFEVEEAATSESLGACKLYQELVDDTDIDDGQFVQCEYDGGGSPPPPGPPECHEASNRWHNMEGPSVNDDVHHEDSDEIIREHFQGCVEINECVVHGESVSEGTMANVAHEDFGQYPASGYEEGEDSPDWNVCLNINSDYTYDNYYEDNDDASEFGGQWYDLDDPIVGEYLRGETDAHTGFDEEHQGDEEGLVEGADTSGRTVSEGGSHIEYFWRENPFPQHDTYNPEGGMEGTALLADCAPNLEGCADDTYNIEDNGVRGGLNDEGGVYFSFFEPGSRIEDYNPRGVDEETEIEPLFNAVLTEARKHSDNNQLGPGSYDYSIYNPDEFNDTEIESSGDWESVAYAYAVNESWTVDSAGRPFPAYEAEDATGVDYVESDTGSHTIPGISPRDDASSDGLRKTEKAFGNSLAVKASSNAENDPDLDVEEGQGYWIDPDNLRERVESGLIKNVEPGTDDWKDLLTFSIDITGPDSGIGWDYSRDDNYDPSRDANRSGEPHPNEIEFQEGSEVVLTDIHWEKNDDGEIHESLQPPVCGDDHNEYLIEEQGSTQNSEMYTGTYACATTNELCFYDEDLYEIGDTVNTGHLEDEGDRVKNDLEVCARAPGDDMPRWYDQDYANELGGTNVCQENDLIGELGVRWIDETYIEDHPFAVNEGIDDSWNDYLNQSNHEYYSSTPGTSSLSSVPTETDFDKVANPDQGYGFCVGDDDEEYLVHQRSNTRYLEEDVSVIGAASEPDKCVLANDRSSIDVESHDGDFDSSERQIYDTGDQVRLNTDDGERVIGCFDGAWWSEWPIVFLDDSVSTVIPHNVRSNFIVINPSDNPIEYELSLSNSDLTDMAEIDQSTVEVPANDYVNNFVEINPVREASGELTVATSQGIDGGGQDQTEVSISSPQVSPENQREVSGLTIVQLAVIVAISSLLFFRN